MFHGGGELRDISGVPLAHAWRRHNVIWDFGFMMKQKPISDQRKSVLIL